MGQISFLKEIRSTSGQHQRGARLPSPRTLIEPSQTQRILGTRHHWSMIRAPHEPRAFPGEQRWQSLHCPLIPFRIFTEAPVVLCATHPYSSAHAIPRDLVFCRKWKVQSMANSRTYAAAILWARSSKHVAHGGLDLPETGPEGCPWCCNTSSSGLSNPLFRAHCDCWSTWPSLAVQPPRTITPWVHPCTVLFSCVPSG